MSRNAMICCILQQFPQELLLDPEIEGQRQVVAQARFHDCQQFLQHDAPDGWHVEMTPSFNGHPGQLYQFGIRTHHTVNGMGYCRGVGGQKTRVESAWTTRRRYGAGYKVNLAEVGVHICLRKFNPYFAGCCWGPITFYSQQKTGFLGGFAHRGECESPREVRTRCRYALQ